ncbi:hypothetical protein DUI87_09728 [Hirundo rustica rustica]|uniref:Uncharacterized protein n=1 Tax=Hirundo rustica rustica TaxID=333673 RepID=A0A3M0KYL9_HIRRU|nr:hypothetical protein DUI87_09728 [Hirundo rustica rustica]
MKKRRKNESFQDMSGMRDKKITIFWYSPTEPFYWHSTSQGLSTNTKQEGKRAAMENRQDELQPKKWDFKTWWLFQDPENLIHMFPEVAATRAEGLISLSNQRIINLEITDAELDKKAEGGTELESTLVITLWWLLCATS